MLHDVFQCLGRVDLIRASLSCRRFRNLASTLDTLQYFANIVIEPSVRGQRFGSREHGWQLPTKSGTVLWTEVGPNREPGFFKLVNCIPYGVRVSDSSPICGSGGSGPNIPVL